ncbi:DUF1194 domain-containing protein [Ponticoccus litoralis]|uniref:DUF1194 domain-containing protein n=1 Tax=Ponticoccus litoralis TaxID=422297 RepID=A0AAW9SA48_9RHOB
MRALVLLLMLWAGGAGAACRQALALGLDVSGSVDAVEYRLQLDGLAGALEDPGVVAAFAALPEAPVAFAVYEWSGPQAQRLLVDWVMISGAADVAAVAARLRRVERLGSDPSTALGAAKRFGEGLLASQAGCWRRVLDISGDGLSNTGPHPRAVRPDGIVINGLVIGAEGDTGVLGSLWAYYKAYVVQGPETFIETASGFADFQEAMVRKLKKELQVLVVSAR